MDEECEKPSGEFHDREGFLVRAGLLRDEWGRGVGAVPAGP
jgi:hypothetical protein